MSRIWHLLTGEYPPVPGGVSEYTETLAVGLAKAGCEVHVWTGGHEPAPATRDDNIVVHRVVGAFRKGDLRRLSDELDLFPGPRTIVVQYVPHAFGYKAMNVHLATWMRNRGTTQQDDLRVMFHEVAMPFVRWPVRHNVIAIVNRLMARTILRGCKHAYVSTPAWNGILDWYGGQSMPRTWLPVPANIPLSVSSDGSIREKMRGGNPNAIVVGHFGTFGGPVRVLASTIFQKLLQQRSQIQAAFIGRGAKSLQLELVSSDPSWKDRIHAADDLSADKIAHWLRSCDVVVQPYPDGVSTRRTTTMACLANGVPVVTNSGRLSESLWIDEQFVAIAACPNPELIAQETLKVVDNPSLLAELACKGRDTYESRFSLAHTVAELMRNPPADVIPR